MSLVTTTVLWALLASAPPENAARRLALVVGNNHGDSARSKLSFAEDDARQMGEVLTQLAGIEPVELLLDQSAEALDHSFDRLARTITPGAPVTLFFFYSGHADGVALLMNGTRYPFDKLRRRLDDLNAQLFVAIIDACQSGELIRSKGGQAVT